MSDPIATSSSQTGSQQDQIGRAREASADRAFLRLGAVAGVVGVILVVVMEGFLHPNHAHPNNSPAAFREYAASDAFTAIHIGDFLGTLLIVIALVALARSLALQGGWIGAFAMFGALAAVVAAAVFTVQMAVDGVALKRAVDVWSAAPSGQKATAFDIADAIRDLEKGLSGFFQMTDGLALLALGVATLLSTVYARWLGVVGALTGIGLLMLGWITAHNGFGTAGILSLAVTALLVVFLLGACVSMLKHE